MDLIFNERIATEYTKPLTCEWICKSISALFNVALASNSRNAVELEIE